MNETPKRNGIIFYCMILSAITLIAAMEVSDYFKNRAALRQMEIYYAERERTRQLVDELLQAK